MYMIVLPKRRSQLSVSGGETPSSPAEKRTLYEYMKMLTDLEIQDVKSIQRLDDPVRAIKLLYINALSRITQLLEPHLIAVKDRANTYIQLDLHEERVRTCDIQSAESISELFSQMSIKAKWDSTTFLQQAVDAIPTRAIERKTAEAILSHYDCHLGIFERATRLKDYLTSTKKSDSEGDRKRVVASKNMVAVAITSSKPLAKLTCQDCRQIQVRILSAAFGIPVEAIICHDAVESQSTTIIFLVPNGFIYAIMQRTTQLETVWVLLELDVIEVAILGFTFKPTVGCFLALLRGSKCFTADLLGVTEVRL